MGRPTIALCVIAKNERRNIEQFFESFLPVVDECHFVDTGSTDGTIEFVTQTHHSNKYSTPIYLHYFSWVNDFAAARNFSFAQATTDYVFWADLDDVLDNPKAFIEWRDTMMHIADFWVATYHYAIHHETGKPVCSFARERVIKRSLNLKWKYFVHEGIPAIAQDGKPVNAQYATSWAVNHMRNAEDLKTDRSRNLNLFKEHLNELDPRMQYYYGKELFENNQPAEAFDWLLKAAKDKSLELHDAILCRQYACMSAQLTNRFDDAIAVAHSGLQLDPLRAEFFICLGDSYIKKNELHKSVPYYEAACNCPRPAANALMQSAIFQHEESYTTYPRNQLARAYFHMGLVDKALAVLEVARATYPNKESDAIDLEIRKIKEKLPIMGGADALKRTDDILISCHPVGFYEWDEGIAKTVGIGGSETAVVQMARELHRQTGRKVLVYNNVTSDREFDGVSYRNAGSVGSYVAEYMPAVHIAWRHNQILTQAPTYLWCHDLMVPGIENHDAYFKAIALSEFHRDYLHTLFRVPKEKIVVSRNGINPERFSKLSFDKVSGKVVFSSSPDRGLERAIAVMDEVVKEVPTTSLHVYYGFDNMIKNGKSAEVKQLESLLMDRSWIHYHGNLEQNKLAEELSSAEVWLYPTNFLETFCIGALEMLLCRVYPVVRKWGALQNTLYEASAKDMATLLDRDCVSAVDIMAYADHVISALRGKWWKRIDFSTESFSWRSVATEWIELMGLSR